MAALRFFARSALSASRPSPVCRDSWKIPFPISEQTQRRWTSQKAAVGTESAELPEFEISRDPKEWAYVERCLREKIIPKAPKNVYDLPSGWKPQNPDAMQLPYMVSRTKNYMMPVYLRIGKRGLRKVTIVKNIQGDIFQLEKELKKYVERRASHVVGTQINEPAGLIKFRGDHVTSCRKFLNAKGF